MFLNSPSVSLQKNTEEKCKCVEASLLDNIKLSTINKKLKLVSF